MEDRSIERYRKITRVFHWIHAASFVLLILTGAVVFLPAGDAGMAQGPSIIHRMAAIIFVAGALIHCVSEPARSFDFLKNALKWRATDLKWFKAAPDYYFGGPESKMYPQGYINTGQKLWQLIAMGTSVVFISTGAAMWFFRNSLSLEAYQWILFAHGVAFVIVIVMFLIHVYMGTLHPRMKGSFRTMIDGRVSPTYVKRHHRKWHDELDCGS